MFNRELFYSLCDKYDVEMSDSFDRFMIKEGGIVRSQPSSSHSSQQQASSKQTENPNPPANDNENNGND